jgi:Leucine-rich repeat (LRR) protein
MHKTHLFSSHWFKKMEEETVLSVNEFSTDGPGLSKRLTLPPAIGELTKLRRIYLSCITRYIPPEIGKLTNLRKLSLPWNHLKSLPSEFGQLLKLRKLRLDENSFTDIPTEIFKLTNLRELILDNNRLRGRLSPQIGQLRKLRRLNLECNRLPEIPAEIGQLENLQTLILTQNALTWLPPELGRLTRLQCIGLFFNELTYVPIELGELNPSEILFDKPLNELFPIAKAVFKLKQSKQSIRSHIRFYWMLLRFLEKQMGKEFPLPARIEILRRAI